MAKSLREQQTQATGKALLAAARKLFSSRRYGDVTAQNIVERAKVTRGALYHHFPEGKAAVFEAVARALQVELVAEMAAAAESTKEPWHKLRAVLVAYFAFAADKTYRQIALLDAPSVIGAKRWHDIEQEYSLSFIEAGLEQMMVQGEIQSLSSKTLAAMVFGACCEATLTIAASGDEESATQEAIDTITLLLKGLRG